MNSVLSFLIPALLAPFKYLSWFVIMAFFPLVFSLLYFQIGADWTVAIFPDVWQNYKQLEEDIVRFLCQVTFLSLWYSFLLRQTSDQPLPYFGRGTFIFFVAYGIIFLMIKAIYWLTTLMQIGLFFIARGFNNGMQEDVQFLLIIGLVMGFISIISATIINRCSFGLPDCAKNNFRSIASSWQSSSPYTWQIFLCTAAFSGIGALIYQLDNYFIIAGDMQDNANLSSWVGETIQHIWRYLRLAMTAALIIGLNQKESAHLN